MPSGSREAGQRQCIPQRDPEQVVQEAGQGGRRELRGGDPRPPGGGGPPPLGAGGRHQVSCHKAVIQAVTADMFYCKYEYYDLAADVLAENAHLTYKYLSPYLYDFLEALITQVSCHSCQAVKLSQLSN